MVTLNTMHRNFLEMLLRKHQSWIFERECWFRIVRAKKTGIFRRIILHRSSSTTQTFDSDTNCYYSAQFLDKESFDKYKSDYTIYSSSTIGLKNKDFEECINIEESRIYIIPDISFNGDKYFETLYRYNRNGYLEKVT